MRRGSKSWRRKRSRGIRGVGIYTISPEMKVFISVKCFLFRCKQNIQVY